MRAGDGAFHKAERVDDFGADVAHDVGPLLCSVTEAELVLFREDARDSVLFLCRRTKEEVICERLTRVFRRRALHLGERFDDVHALKKLLSAAAALL